MCYYTDYANELGYSLNYTNKEFLNLVDASNSGDTVATDKIICAVAKDISKIVHRYAKVYDVCEEDLLSKSMLSLIDAIRVFDTSKGVVFKSYICQVTWFSIIRSVAEEKGIPSNYLVKFKEFEKYCYELSIQEKDIAFSKTFNEFSKDFGLNFKVPLMVSIDNLDSFLREESFDQDLVNNISLKEIISELINCLSDRGKFIVCQKLGLFGNESKSLKEISINLGITEARARQLYNISLNKLLLILRERYAQFILDY